MKAAKTTRRPTPIATTKDTTKAIETKAGVLQNGPDQIFEAALGNQTNIYLQYLGQEFCMKDIVKRVRAIGARETGKRPEELKQVNIYLKPEEGAAYYVIDHEINGKIELSE